jgi:hypothetical protein
MLTRKMPKNFLKNSALFAPKTSPSPPFQGRLPRRRTSVAGRRFGLALPGEGIMALSAVLEPPLHIVVEVHDIVDKIGQPRFTTSWK